MDVQDVTGTRIRVPAFEMLMLRCSVIQDEFTLHPYGRLTFTLDGEPVPATHALRSNIFNESKPDTTSVLPSPDVSDLYQFCRYSGVTQSVPLNIKSSLLDRASLPNSRSVNPHENFDSAYVMP